MSTGRVISQSNMTNFFDITLRELEGLLENLGLKRYRAHQIYKWVYQAGVQDFDRMTNLSKDLMATLKGMFHFGLPVIQEKVASKDGSLKFLLSAGDGHVV